MASNIPDEKILEAKKIKESFDNIDPEILRTRLCMGKYYLVN